jgi:undecaprenyl-diphosphatase
MSTLEAIVLGLVQGLTEFLPVSSSGHLVIGKELLGIDSSGVAFEVVVHAATVLSTLVAFRKDILELLSGVLKFKMNGQTIYVFKILISMVPVFIVGMFLKDHVEALF